MSTFHSIIVILHIAIGTLALLLFWVPILTKKGALNHVRFGRAYSIAMYIVAACGAIASIMVLYDPMAIKGALIAAKSNKQDAIHHYRVFYTFLLYLSLLSYVTTRQGMAAIEHKHNHAALRKPLHILPIVALLLGGILMFWLWYQYSHPLYLVFAIIGSIVASDMLHYCLQKSVTRIRAIIAHLGAMIGSAIGAYTAFFAFGGRTFLQSLTDNQLVFWILPSIVGTIAISLWSMKYKRMEAARS